MAFDLNGRVALVTGAARGIGFETSRALLARGAKVVLVDLDADATEKAAAELGGSALGIGTDVTDADAIAAAIDTAVETFGGLDVIVANAGIAPMPATARAMGSEEFDRVLEVDLLGVWRTVRPALPHIIERKGHVVVTSSVYAFVNGMGNAPYAMAKAGVEALGRTLRIELHPHGASASVAYFGFIDTPMVHEALDNNPNAELLRKGIPKPLLKRLPPSEAGEAVARGIERRQVQIIVPKRWRVLSTLRGLNPLLDLGMEKRADVLEAVRSLDSR